MNADFDVVVIGAGSAGCVVASRLSEDPSLSVALVDAGGRDHTQLTRVPAAVLKTLGHPRYDWRMKTEPDPTREGRVDQIARGRVLGGSSAINGLIFVRGTAADFDGWAAEGNDGWEWNSVLPLFRRMERIELQDNAVRGGLGPQDVSFSSYRHPLTDTFIEAAGKLGLPFNSDYNGASQEGVGYVQGTIRRGRRVSAYDGYIAPNLKRPNLTVLPRHHAMKLQFEGDRATGVWVRHKGGESVIRARKAVVVSLGSFNTPQLLMLSGLGPADELQRHGIDLRQHIPGVGQNLLDHTGFRIVVEVDTDTANNQARGLNIPKYLWQWLRGGQGPVGAASAEAIGFFCSRPALERPDLQITFFPYASEFNAKGRAVLKRRSLASLGVNLNFPRSRGSVTLRSADPFDPVCINYRLFEDERDLDTLVKGLHVARAMVDEGPFAQHVTDRVAYPTPEAGEQGDRDFVRRNSRSYMHPISTCRLGTDADAVVAPDLRVHGVERLWVADASIFPSHISGNINATTMMVGEKASDILKHALSRA